MHPICCQPNCCFPFDLLDGQLVKLRNLLDLSGLLSIDWSTLLEVFDDNILMMLEVDFLISANTEVEILLESNKAWVIISL